MWRSAASWFDLGEELDPAGFAHRHRVGMIVPDVDRRADGAVSERHHDRQAEAGGVVDRLRHEQEALARRRGIGARAGGRGADGDRERREFALDIDELAIVELAEPDELAEALDDMGLRRDRIGADDLRPAERDRARHGLRAFDLVQHRRTVSRCSSGGGLGRDERMRRLRGLDIGFADFARKGAPDRLQDTFQRDDADKGREGAEERGVRRRAVDDASSRVRSRERRACDRHAAARRWRRDSSRRGSAPC